MLRSCVSMSVKQGITRLTVSLMWPRQPFKEPKWSPHGGLVCVPITSWKKPPIKYEASFCWCTLNLLLPHTLQQMCCSGNGGLVAFQPHSEGWTPGWLGGSVVRWRMWKRSWSLYSDASAGWCLLGWWRWCFFNAPWENDCLLQLSCVQHTYHGWCHSKSFPFIWKLQEAAICAAAHPYLWNLPDSLCQWIQFKDTRRRCSTKPNSEFNQGVREITSHQPPNRHSYAACETPVATVKPAASAPTCKRKDRSGLLLLWITSNRCQMPDSKEAFHILILW